MPIRSSRHVGGRDTKLRGRANIRLVISLSLIMEIELLPTVSLLPETFTVLIAPVELLTGALNSHLELQRYKILFISGRSSSRLNRNFTELEVRRAFAVYPLMTIPTGEPPQLPDRGARLAALRRRSGHLAAATEITEEIRLCKNLVSGRLCNQGLIPYIR
jgi:hypothetical protein